MIRCVIFKAAVLSTWLLMAAVFVPSASAVAAAPASRPPRDTVAGDLWVDAVGGSDAYDGLSPATAFRTIQKAANLADPGITVHILPGVYRETVQPMMSGSATEPIIYTAEDGPGTAILRGSEPSSSLRWTRLTTDLIGLPPGVDPSNVYYADLSSWALKEPPRFIVQLDGAGNPAARLPLAREPDWQVATAWKHHEFWWAAEGGSGAVSCDPTTNCDLPWRSTTQLTDRSNDTQPAGIEPGNLTTLGNLTGATLVAVDTFLGHWTYRRTIIAHDVSAGRITVDRPCALDGDSEPALGWGSKYFVEGTPYLIDSPGEWWYDARTGRLYLWPPMRGDPAAANIEISRRTNGFHLSNRSYITLDGLTVEFFDDNAVSQDNDVNASSYDNTVRNAIIRYANIGIRLSQGVGESARNITDGFVLENSEIAQMDSRAIHSSYWWPGGTTDSFTHAGIVNTVIRNNELHHLGFRSDSADGVGVVFFYPDRLRFEGNHVHDVAHNGVQFNVSIVQSPQKFGFAPSEIKTGNVLILNNVVEKACQSATDCGALKFWGYAPKNHVFRDVLVTGNILRNTFGWTYIAEKRGRWAGGANSSIQGMGGFGLYVDHASGLHVYRNIAYNNAYSGFHLYGVWRDGDMVFYNNIAANSLVGFRLDGMEFDTHGSINTQIFNNIMVNNEGYGIVITDATGDYGNLLVDHNLYDSNGWRAYEDGGMWRPGAMVVYLASTSDRFYPTLADIRANTSWEANGVAGAPGFWDYDYADYDLFDGSWPDFHLTSASVNALDRGTAALPASLITLLNTFEVTDSRRGQAYDIGRYEVGFALLANPAAQFVGPGGVARYALRLDPPDLPYDFALTPTSPSPFLEINLSAQTLTADEAVTLTVTHSAAGPTGPPPLVYTVPITATGGGFTETANVRLLVDGARPYLPLILRNDAG